MTRLAYDLVQLAGLVLITVGVGLKIDWPSAAIAAGIGLIALSIIDVKLTRGAR